MNAQEMNMKRSTFGKTFAIAAVTALGLGVAPTAKASDKGCTNASLKGTFSHIGTGFITAVGPFAGGGTDIFDGNGGLRGAATLTMRGKKVSGDRKRHYKRKSDAPGTYKMPSVTTDFVTT